MLSDMSGASVLWKTTVHTKNNVNVPVGICSYPPSYLQTSPSIWTQGNRNTSNAHKLNFLYKIKYTFTYMGISFCFNMFLVSFKHPNCVRMSSLVCGQIFRTNNTAALRGTKNLFELSIFRTVYNIFLYFPY